MKDLIGWLRLQLDDHAREMLDVQGKREYTPAEARLIRAIQDGIEGARERLDRIEVKLADDPDDQTTLWMLKREACSYARRPGYREEWKP